MNPSMPPGTPFGRLAKAMKALGCSVTILLTLLLIGCAQPAAYREPITRFQQASTVVIESARVYYRVANKGERDAEIDRRVARGKEIRLRVLNDKKLRLLGPDELAARIAALDTLAKHGRLLLTLARSDATAKAKDAANSLSGAVIELNKSLGLVPAGPFKIVAEGFAKILAEAAQLVLEAKIAEALDKAILASEKDVKDLISLLREEVSELYERRRDSLHAARVSATDEYNEELEKENPSFSKLRQAADRIKKAEDAWDNLPLLLGAGSGLDTMEEAHQQLVYYAESDKEPQDLAALVESIDAFVTRATVIGEATKTILGMKD